MWLAINLHQLGLEVFSERATQPCALAEQNRIVCSNNSALACGVVPGLRSTTAYSLCASLRLLCRDEVLEQQRLQNLAEQLSPFSPIVCIAPPHMLVLDMRGCLHLHGGTDQLQSTLQQHLQQLGHNCALAWGSNAISAQVLAAHRQLAGARETIPEAISDPACERLWQRRLHQELRDVPLQVLPASCLPATQSSGTPATWCDALESMGLHTLGDVHALPRAPLRRRFGAGLPKVLDQLFSDAADLRRPVPQCEHFSSTLHFMDELSDLASMQQPLQRLCNELVQWLRVRQQIAVTLHWSLRCAGKHGKRKEIVVRLAQACADGERFYELTLLQLQALELPERIQTIALHCPRSELQYIEQLQNNELFPIQQQDAQHWQLLEQLQARLGRARCQQIMSLADHRPEQAHQHIEAGSKNTDSEAPLHRGFRPLWLLAQPEPIPEPQTLQFLRGPERISSNWWSITPHRTRDYYVARSTQGSLLWVFASTAACEAQPALTYWYLHGYFA